MTSPLNSSLVVESGMSSGVAARAAEKRKHLQNDAKCKQLARLVVHSFSGETLWYMGS